MEFAVHLDDRWVEMLVITSDGTTVAIECEKNSILRVQHHIELIMQSCPEIATWTVPQTRGLGISSREADELIAAFDAAVSEGWPVKSEIRQQSIAQSAYGWT